MFGFLVSLFVQIFRKELSEFVCVHAVWLFAEQQVRFPVLPPSSPRPPPLPPQTSLSTLEKWAEPLREQRLLVLRGR